jgi:hypothetical protein
MLGRLDQEPAGVVIAALGDRSLTPRVATALFASKNLFAFIFISFHIQPYG